MIAKRVKECLAMMIGDGVLEVVEPRHHLRLWESCPPWWGHLPNRSRTDRT
jgi:hypothetical protein